MRRCFVRSPINDHPQERIAIGSSKGVAIVLVVYYDKQQPQRLWYHMDPNSLGEQTDKFINSTTHLLLSRIRVLQLLTIRTRQFSSRFHYCQRLQGLPSFCPFLSFFILLGTILVPLVLLVPSLQSIHTNEASLHKRIVILPWSPWLSRKVCIEACRL